MTDISPIVNTGGGQFRARYMQVEMISTVLQGGVSMVHYRTEDGRELYLSQDQWQNLFVPILTTTIVMEEGTA